MNKRNFASLKRGLEEANEAMAALRTYYDALLADEPPAYLLEILAALPSNSESRLHDLSGSSSDTREFRRRSAGDERPRIDIQGQVGG